MESFLNTDHHGGEQQQHDLPQVMGALEILRRLSYLVKTGLTEQTVAATSLVQRKAVADFTALPLASTSV